MRNAVQLCLAANNILHVCKGNRAFLLLAIALAWKWQIASPPEGIHEKNKLGDRMIKQLLNSVIAKYRDLSVSHRSIICLSLQLQQIIDLLATDKSQYFAQPRPIIVNYSFDIFGIECEPICNFLCCCRSFNSSSCRLSRTISSVSCHCSQGHITHPTGSLECHGNSLKPWSTDVIFVTISCPCTCIDPSHSLCLHGRTLLTTNSVRWYWV